MSHRLPRIVALGLLLMGSCAPDAPQVEIRELIERGERAAEQRRVGELADLVAPTYADAEGRDRAALVGLVRGYLAHGGSIHLLTRIESLRVTAPERAEVTLLLAAAALPISGVLDLDAVSADLLRVELELERARGDWRLTRAAWAPATVADFLRATED